MIKTQLDTVVSMKSVCSVYTLNIITICQSLCTRFSGNQLTVRFTIPYCYPLFMYAECVEKNIIRCNESTKLLIIVIIKFICCFKSGSDKKTKVDLLLYNGLL